MVSTDVNVKTLKINQLTEAQYNAAVQGGVIGANELSFITDATYTTTLPSQTGHAGDYLTTNGTDLSWGSLANDIPVVVQDFYVNGTTGAITCTFSGTPTTKSVHTIIGNTAIAGTWNANVFTPTTASDILNNANGFIVSVA